MYHQPFLWLVKITGHYFMFKLQYVDGLHHISAKEWNALVSDMPFLQYEFLYALETTHCLVENGWYPRHFLLYKADELIAAVPAYIKTNSYGEFVFDWSWASAYERVNIPYYPKLVVGIPYTPITGPRILLKDPAFLSDAISIFQKYMMEFCQEYNLSSLHWLFTPLEQTQALEKQACFKRTGCQYHWYNHDYTTFQDYLADFTSHRRNNVKRERRKVKENDISIEIKSGNEISPDLWDILYQFYTITFDKKWGYATLTLDFFKTIAQTMAENIMVVLAKHHHRYVAAAINFRSQTQLFGRYWGCFQEYDSLHFEVCYYSGIEYCIQENLKIFQPGAGGEHKISRGFLPTYTWSAHWIAHPQFSYSLQDFCQREEQMIQEQYINLMEMSPFKKNG